jgi:uncharacterized protein YidB (DUF937 family)
MDTMKETSAEPSFSTTGETEKITEAVTASVGSPSKGLETSSGQSVLMSILLRKIEDGELDLHTLVARFRGSGLAGKAETWLSAGENATLLADEVEMVFGPRDLERLSKEAGIPTKEIAIELAELLPKLIDQFTQHGILPEGSTINEAASQLSSKID